MGDSRQEGSPFTGGGHFCPPSPRAVEAVGVAPEGAQFISSSLSTKVVVLRMRPPVRSRVPPWDLAVVLEALCRHQFKPIEEISDRQLTVKTTFLLAISSLKRVGYLQALSVAPFYLDFAPGLAKAFLYPRAGYVPKVSSSTPRPVVHQHGSSVLLSLGSQTGVSGVSCPMEKVGPTTGMLWST